MDQKSCIERKCWISKRWWNNNIYEIEKKKKKNGNMFLFHYFDLFYSSYFALVEGKYQSQKKKNQTSFTLQKNLFIFVK